MYSDLNFIHHARKVFDEITHRTIYGWNAIFCALSIFGLRQDVLSLYRKMNEIGMPNDRFTYTYAEYEGGNPKEAEASNPSQGTPMENMLPIVIDDEVSPKASKSLSFKHFKFSSGMLIKPSQDDFTDEVTWKISPVNERLDALSKNLPGRMRVFADSTRFNSMNFQPCSQKKGANLSWDARKTWKMAFFTSTESPLKILICFDGHTSRN